MATFSAAGTRRRAAYSSLLVDPSRRGPLLGVKRRAICDVERLGHDHHTTVNQRLVALKQCRQALYVFPIRSAGICAKERTSEGRGAGML